jgi:hypothetical protein
MATLTPNTDGSYNAYLEVSVQGSGNVTGLGHIEKENAKQFQLDQNFPNPHIGTTTIPFSLATDAEVNFSLFDLMGRKVSTIDQGKLSSGSHKVTLNLQQLGLAQGNYLYQIEVKNSNGTFRQCKMMTAQ